jgi:Fe-S cluster assembly protein SufD
MTAALPTRKDEAWRYADFKALMRMRTAGAVPAGRFDTIFIFNDCQTQGHENSQHPATDYRLQPGVQHSLIQILDGSDHHAGQMRATLAEGASLDHVILQTRGAEAGTTLSAEIILADNARYRVHLCNIGSDYARLDLDVALNGSGARAELHALQLADESQTLEVISRFHHNVPGTSSQQSVRSLAGQRGTVTYLGGIKVAPDAQGTDASQSSKAILLARTASANSKPELVIHADDVKCAHGATVGELDAQALFYLQSRGLDPAQARALLIEAFMADIIDAIGAEDTQVQVRAAVMQKLATMVSHA